MFNDLLDGLTPADMYKLITWLGVKGYPVSRANIKGWIKQHKEPETPKLSDFQQAFLILSRF